MKGPSRISFILTATIFCLCLATMVFVAGLPFAYPLDDTYIHLALGRTLAATGVWGIQPEDPAAASSSPLWSLLLAAGYLALPESAESGLIWFPLVLNGVAGIFLIFIWSRILSGQRYHLFSLISLWFTVSLSALALIGMEHVLHIALATALLWTAVRAITQGEKSQPLFLISTLAGLAAVSRYETLFLIAPLVALAVLRGRYTLAVALCAGAGSPILAFGLVWSHEGGWLLPNALLLKGAQPGEGSSEFIARVWAVARNFFRNSRTDLGLQLLVVAAGVSVLAALVWLRTKTIWRSDFLFAVASTAALVIHLCFASVGWLYRYEAWLLALLVLSVLLLWHSLPISSMRGSGIVLVALIVVCLPRTARSIVHTVQSVDDRRLEHITVAGLLRSAYSGQTIVVNDLGAVAYYGNVRALDMYGLGHNEPIRLRNGVGGYNAAALEKWARSERASVAVFQICWSEVYSRLPRAWPLVAMWEIPRNRVFGDHLVGFFATNEEEAVQLRAALKAYVVPQEIKVRFGPNPAFDRFRQADVAAQLELSKSLGCWTPRSARKTLGMQIEE